MCDMLVQINLTWVEVGLCEALEKGDFEYNLSLAKKVMLQI